MENKTVNVVEYNPKWPRVFERTSKRMGDMLDQTITGIEHIGSTAVPGLSARPVIDIALLLPTASQIEEVANILLSNSFNTCSMDTEVPGERILQRNRPDDPSMRLFLCDNERETGFTRLVRFRELLRTDQELARRYETLKLGLAREFEDDPDAYEAEKSAFVHTLEEVYLES